MYKIIYIVFMLANLENVQNISSINKFLKNKIIEKKHFTFEPSKKHLTIIACHLNNYDRVRILKKNIRFLDFPNNDIIIVNSSNLECNKEFISELQNKVKQYIEIPNDKWLDFGKWKYVLNNIDYSEYEFITFTNDSFSILNPILFYFNLVVAKNKDLYGYSSSSEVKYHFQSYLFSVKTSAIYKFKQYLAQLHNHNNVNAVHLEINLIDVFQSRDCFLDIGKLYINDKKNVFFNNNFLYFTLFNCNLLPFIKIKRLTGIPNRYNKISMILSPKV